VILFKENLDTVESHFETENKIKIDYKQNNPTNNETLRSEYPEFY